jgi:ABC-type dipeptide/oligopeptide/nickel transport system permease component
MKTNTIFAQIYRMAVVCLVMLTLFLGFTKLVEAAIPPQVQQEIQPGSYEAGKKAVRDTSKNINNTLENVKEKLNLDEPIPESTKEFLANPLAKPKDQNPPEHPVGSNV